MLTCHFFKHSVNHIFPFTFIKQNDIALYELLFLVVQYFPFIIKKSDQVEDLENVNVECRNFAINSLFVENIFFYNCKLSSYSPSRGIILSLNDILLIFSIDIILTVWFSTYIIFSILLLDLKKLKIIWLDLYMMQSWKR